MTEAEWLSSEDAKEMLRCLHDQLHVQRRKAGRRKLQLFGCGSCRTRWEAMIDPRSRAAVEYIEQLADGQADRDDQERIQEDARQALVAVEKAWMGRPDRSERAADRQAQEEAAAAAPCYWPDGPRGRPTPMGACAGSSGRASQPSTGFGGTGSTSWRTCSTTSSAIRSVLSGSVPSPPTSSVSPSPATPRCPQSATTSSFSRTRWKNWERKWVRPTAERSCT
jgi:hypothetical protein